MVACCDVEVVKQEVCGVLKIREIAEVSMESLHRCDVADTRKVRINTVSNTFGRKGINVH